MKLNKQVIIILVLLSLLISSIGAAAYFYMKNKKTAMDNSKLVTIYVASKDIKQGSIINEEMLKQTSIAKKFILTKPLLKKEIVGKFAKEAIYENDIFRKEKISTKLEQQKSLISSFKYNSYNIAFKLFQNPNYSLRKDDIIDIISVYENKIDDGKDGKINIQDPYKVQIIADNVKVLGFLRDGEESDKTIVEEVVTKQVKKKTVTEKVKVKADELLLDITSNVLLKLTDDYNKGKQIWMVKTRVVKKQPVKPEVKVTKKGKRSVYKEYPYRKYTPKERTDTLTATIHYADNDEASIRKSKVVQLNKINECKKKEKFIIGTSKYVHFRSGPSVGYKIKRTIYKNIIVPIDEKVNDSWYRTCDDYFINARQVEEATKEQVEEKLIQRYLIKK